MSPSLSLRRLLVALFAIVVCLTVPAVRLARAQDAAVEEMRKHFETGQSLFEKGEFQKAADEFMAAYAAKPFPAFLFNAGVCYERLQQYPKAIELFQRYLKESPDALDKKDVEARIKQLQDQIEKEKAITPPTTQPDATQPDATQPTTQPDNKPPALPEQKTKGLVVIESKPPGATIYLDSKQQGALVGKTPWNGSLDGEHTIILESKGYKTEKQKITPAGDKLVYMYVALSEEHYLGFVEIRSNVKHADVFIDSKEQGTVGTTPWLGNLRPGKHTVWVTKDGYTEHTETIEVQGGKAITINGALELAPFGFVTLRPYDTASDKAHVKVDGKDACKTVPCAKLQIPEGKHDISIGQSGKRTLHQKLVVAKGTQTTITFRMSPTSSHTDAIAPLLIGAALIGGGYFLQTKMNEQMPGSDREREYKVGMYSAYVLGGIVFVDGVYSLFRTKGQPSQAVVESRALTWAPAVGPGYAGMAALLRF